MICINGSKILILGVAYKKNIDDMRETPALKLMEILREKGADVDYYDPFVPVLPSTRKYKYDMKSIDFNADNIAQYDLVLIVTDHSDVDYGFIHEHAQLIVDTRNVYHSIKSDKIIKA